MMKSFFFIHLFKCVHCLGNFSTLLPSPWQRLFDGEGFQMWEAFGWREAFVWRKNTGGRLLKGENEWLKGNWWREIAEGEKWIAGWREKNCWRRIAKGELLNKG
jgi:hypothetical protein